MRAESPRVPLVVVVTGPPTAGKTTIAPLELDPPTHVDDGAVAEFVRGELQASYAP